MGVELRNVQEIMKSMKNLTLLALTLGTTLFSFGQNVLMGDPGFDQANPADCSTFGTGANNFFDDGNAGNYSANFNDTTVFCPDLSQGTKMTITFATNAGFEFDVDGSDSIYVYDGPNTNAPLLGVHNSDTDPNGFTYTASWANNPSGCLTVVFISDGANEGTGWVAQASCGNQAQPYEMHIEAYINGQGTDALNPADTGFVDVCFGDSILFVATPIFPYSPDVTGFGYPQNVNNVQYEWLISDGGTYPANDSIWFTPPTRNGFLVDLGITDAFPQIQHMLCKVRVSQLPIFAGTGPLSDTLCLGDSTTIVGGVNATDTVGISIPPGSFQLGGSFAGLTFLPDGSGAQYQAPIDISGFPPGSTINNAQDLNMVCLTMEHSYIGDLEVALQCPNGTQVTIFDAYNGGFIPGGGFGFGTDLGDPIPSTGTGPGTGWEYCFSSVFNTQGILSTGATIPNSNGVSYDSAGVYQPEQSFAGFAGCPVNGQWTIIVQDNLGIDDGYIFQWGLFFDPSYFPGSSTYQNTIVSGSWQSSPTIISGLSDTSIVVMPDTGGDHFYTYAVTDDFGCDYDTTVAVHALPTATILNDTVLCNLSLQVAGTSSHTGGEWFSNNPEISFAPNAQTLNPTVNATTSGSYTIGFVDASCGDTLYANVDFIDPPVIFQDTSVCSLSFGVTGTQVYQTGGVWSSTASEISFQTSTDNNPTINATASGVYTVTFTDNACGASVDADVEFVAPPTIFGDTTVCSNLLTTSGNQSYFGGEWTVSDTALHISDSSVLNPDFFVLNLINEAVYTVTFTDSVCNESVSAMLTFPPFPYTEALDTVICAGSVYEIFAQDNPTVDNFEWNTGESGQSITVTQPGDYIVTGSNICYSITDTATVEWKPCDIDVPNVISLSSQVGNNQWFVNHQGVQDFHCTIVNRWGNLIYEFSDPNAAWLGQTLNGNMASEGTYFYIIDVTFDSGEMIQKQGFVQVVQ